MDCYATLGLYKNASIDEIKSALKLYHQKFTSGLLSNEELNLVLKAYNAAMLDAKNNLVTAAAAGVSSSENINLAIQYKRDEGKFSDIEKISDREFKERLTRPSELRDSRADKSMSELLKERNMVNSELESFKPLLKPNESFNPNLFNRLFEHYNAKQSEDLSVYSIDNVKAVNDVTNSNRFTSYNEQSGTGIIASSSSYDQYFKGINNNNIETDPNLIQQFKNMPAASTKMTSEDYKNAEARRKNYLNFDYKPPKKNFEDILAPIKAETIRSTPIAF
jgi:hypothetical protein